MKKTVTIQDVADIVGVSKTTISRYINGNYKNMSEDTRERIAHVIKELNYHPNRQAQSLKSYKSYLIGLVIADISNLYTAYLIQAMFDSLQESEYQLIIMNSNNDLTVEQSAIQRLLNYNVDAMILQPVSAKDSDYQMLWNQSFPVTLLDRSMIESRWPVVQTDNLTRTRELAELIVNKNYERVVHITESIESVSPRYERYIAMKSVITQPQHKMELELWEVTDESKQIESCLRNDSSSKRTAYFAANGNVLQALLLSLRQQGYQYPQDCGVAGYDDWQIGKLMDPPLTVIAQDPKALGQKVIQVTFDQIENGHQKGYIEIATKLFERDSL